MVIISASLILPFLLRVLGVFGEGFESESAFCSIPTHILCRHRLQYNNFRNFAAKFQRGLFYRYLSGFL